MNGGKTPVRAGVDARRLCAKFHKACRGRPAALLDADADADGAGRAFHAAADDYVTDPSGNSAARIVRAAVHPVAELR
jgi:hypothetical protein